MTWYLHVSHPRPEIKIDRNSTYLIINGRSCRPRTYTVPQGTIVKLNFKVVNSGGSGQARIVVRDARTGRTYYDRTVSMSKGGSYSDNVAITVDSEIALQVVAYYLDTESNNWVQSDEYG